MKSKSAGKKKRSMKLFRTTYIVLIFVLIVMIFVIEHFRESYLNKGKITSIDDIVAQELGKKPNKLTSDDFQKIESLQIYRFICHDLKPLQKLSNIKNLYINNLSKPVDSSPVWLKRLRQSLRVQKSDQMAPFDLKPLTKLEKLERLSLYSINFENIEPLGELKNLKSLSLDSLSNKSIKDINPLMSLPNLQFLEIYRIDNKALSSLSNFTNLRELTLALTGSGKINLSFAANLKNLQKFSLSSNAGCVLKDISPLAELPDLEYLDIFISGFNDISPLAELKNLQHLSLDSKDINDISLLAKLTNLQNLFLDNSNIKDIAALSKLKNLKFLSLYTQQISDIKPLEGLINLKSLVLIDTNIKDITPIKNLKNLKELRLQNCENISDQQIEDLRKALPGLKIKR
jgi:Leucine-rich repeat (LRR) protein